jgi:hypothetical protein
MALKHIFLRFLAGVEINKRGAEIVYRNPYVRYDILLDV